MHCQNMPMRANPLDWYLKLLS